jgi:hypothetical protein
VIKKTMSQEPPQIATFGFTADGIGVSDFDSITTAATTGTGSKTINLLATGPDAGSRTITETGFPFVSDAVADGGDADHDKFWWTKNVSCVSLTNPGGVSLAPPFTGWTTVIPTFTVVNNYRSALGDNPPTGDLTLRQGSVTVTNLAALDTLTCTFDNRLFNDDVAGNN